MELLTGAGNKSEMTLILKKLDKYNILLINDEITLKDFDLVQNYFLSHSLQLPDALIAASAMVTGFELFTYNSKDYRFITGLKLFKVARDL
jgi:predicted nucleic acid-binding protein